MIKHALRLKVESALNGTVMSDMGFKGKLTPTEPQENDTTIINNVYLYLVFAFIQLVFKCFRNLNVRWVCYAQGNFTCNSVRTCFFNIDFW